jgi:hypothetical protein
MLLLPDKRLIYRELEDKILEPYDKIFLNMASIDKDAFVDLPNLKSLHLRLVKNSGIDLEHMINLRELCLESHPVIDTLMYKQMLPANLEKLSIIGFPIQLESLMNLSNLISLELESVCNPIFANSKPFALLKNLKQLSIKKCYLLFQGSDFKTNKIEFGSEEIEDLTLYNNTYRFDHVLSFINDTEPMIYFENLPNLKKLNLFISYLNTDKKSSINVDSFRKLVNLEFLEFSVKSSSIDSQEGMRGLLNNFTKLKTLKLRHISSIDESSFSHLVNLETLELSGCYFGFSPNYMKRSISCNAFANLNKLTHLVLGKSFELENLDASLFKYTHNLESFAVAGLKKIQDGAFINLDKLKKLNLKHCDFVEITANTFQGLNSLEKLNLSFNKLESIDARSFDHLKTLKHLNLCKLKHVIYNVFFLITKDLIEVRKNSKLSHSKIRLLLKDSQG